MDWHTRYVQQARWTEQLRSYLFGKVGIPAGGRVLEPGCGTGALLCEFPPLTTLHGLDVNYAVLDKAGQHAPGAVLACGDVASLPYADGVFDLAYCHFLLLWLPDPLGALKEMRRVTRSGGVVLALAEPDYGGRIDYPEPLSQVGRWQADSLRKQGADPVMGRKLAGLFVRAGFRGVESGILGGEWHEGGSPVEDEQEWNVLAHDTEGAVSREELLRLKTLDQAARANGERVLFVPTFFAWGRV